MRLQIGALCALLFCAGCASQRGLFFDTTMQFDEGRPVQVDGHHEAGEWSDALELPLSKGGDLLMKRSGNLLYLAVLLDNNHPVCLGLMHGNEIRVAHCEYYLSTARYAREGETWRRTAPYRSVKISDPQSREIVDHLERTGWTGSAKGWYGERFIELCVELPPEGLKLALSAQIRASDRNPPHWPPGLDDGLLEPRLLEGKAPETLDFDTDKWPLFVAEDPTGG